MSALQIFPIIVPTDRGQLKSFNFYLVKTNDNFLLIDAGVNNEKSWHALKDTLDKQQLTIDDIDAILLTHNHSDHTGLVNPIRAKHDIPVYAHQDAVIRLKRDEEFLRNRVLFYENLFKKMGSGQEADKQVQRLNEGIEKNAHEAIHGDIITFKEGDTLFGLDVYEVPGHAPDHVMFWHESSKSMFVGDHVLKNSPTNALVECDKEGNRLPTLVQYEHSLKKLLKFDIAWTYPGHGDVIENTDSLVKGKLARMNKKGERIKHKLTKPKSAAQIAKEMYGERYKTLFPLIMSEVVGHLDRLHHLNEVIVQNKTSIDYFSLK